MQTEKVTLIFMAEETEAQGLTGKPILLAELGSKPKHYPQQQPD